MKYHYSKEENEYQIGDVVLIRGRQWHNIKRHLLSRVKKGKYGPVVEDILNSLSKRHASWYSHKAEITWMGSRTETQHFSDEVFVNTQWHYSVTVLEVYDEMRLPSDPVVGEVQEIRGTGFLTLFHREINEEQDE